MNWKMMTLTFFEHYKRYIKKIRAIVFLDLLINLFKQRYSSYVKSYKYLNKLISQV